MKMKKIRQKTPHVPPAVPSVPGPQGAFRKLRKDDYQALKLAFQDVTLADHSVQQTVALAQRAIGLARELHGQAEARAKALMNRHSLPDGNYAFSDEACSVQRMG